MHFCLECILFAVLFTSVVKSDFSLDDVRKTGGDMKFVLHTRNNPTEGEFFNIDSLRNTTFKTDRPVKILIHGWLGSYKQDFGILIKEAYLMQYDVNVIIIDWAKEAGHWWYPTARSTVPLIGSVVAHLVDEMIQTIGVDPRNIHIIGHSLGAHVAGIAGHTAKFGPVARVTGLDPAAALFSYEDDLRISTDSAEFVDIIHTDIYKAGFVGALGHIDFYPNGGYKQPMESWDILSTLSHLRAFWLFAESITTPGGFLAVECEDWETFKTNKCSSNQIAEMGEHVSESSTGVFYLTTNGKSPFARGKYSLTYNQ